MLNWNGNGEPKVGTCVLVPSPFTIGYATPIVVKAEVVYTDREFKKCCVRSVGETVTLFVCNYSQVTVIEDKEAVLRAKEIELIRSVLSLHNCKPYHVQAEKLYDYGITKKKILSRQDFMSLANGRTLPTIYEKLVERGYVYD
jgi:hypothetical protein